jgi:pimeloyl-ACP methyl ester carboxylesterase
VRRQGLLLVALVCAITGLVGCRGDDTSSTVGSITTDATSPKSRLVDATCPPEIDGVAGARCWRFIVPERRDGTSARTISLSVVRLPSRGVPPAAPDPVLVLQGGPGDAPQPASFVEHPLRDHRDVYVLDQRGTGHSEPSLACPEVSEESYRALGEDIDDPATNAGLARAAQRCRDRLTKSGIDLAAYNTAANAADVADLRRALHVREWDLAGNSYGSRLALTVLRDHPDGVRAVALSGVYPPDRNTFTDIADATADAFDAFFTTHPGLRDTFVALVERLERAPVRVRVVSGSGRKVNVLFDGDNLVIFLRQALYTTSLLPALPAVIDQLASGRGFDAVAKLVADQAPANLDASRFAFGMHYSVQCQEDVPSADLATVRAAVSRYPSLDAVTMLRDAYRAICAVWRVAAQPAAVRAPVRSAVPVLMMTGALDPATPPKWARRAVRTLVHGYAFVLPGYGHDTTALDCPRRVRNRFFDQPRRRPADRCIAEPPG